MHRDSKHRFGDKVILPSDSTHTPSYTQSAKEHRQARLSLGWRAEEEKEQSRFSNLPLTRCLQHLRLWLARAAWPGGQSRPS